MAAGSKGATNEEVHAADAHDVGGGHDHEHASGHDQAETHGESHDGEALGPVDWRAWGFALLGVGAAALIAAFLYASASAA